MTSKPVGKLLNPYQRSQVCAILTVGGSRQAAASYVGCTVATIERVARQSRVFRRQLEQAKSQHEITHLENIRSAGKKSWRASAWALEHRYPERYASRKLESFSKLQVTELLSRIAAVLNEEVHDAQVMQALQEKLGEISVDLIQAGEAEP